MSIGQMIANDFYRFPSVIENYFKLGQFVSFSEHHQIYYETDQYVLKTASRIDEVFKTFKLRYRSFTPDTFLGRVGLDLDEYDFHSDHIVIIDKYKNKVCGTYRIRCSELTNSFYSQSEFDLSDFMKEPGVKIELGRACVHPRYRNGTVLNLLWHGIGRYMNATGAKYLIGCSSIKTMELDKIKLIDDYFNRNNMKSDQYKINPIGKFAFDYDDIVAPERSDEEISELIPSLLMAYLKFGAKIYGCPALDRDFHCIDYLTILDIDEMHRAFKRKFCKC